MMPLRHNGAWSLGVLFDAIRISHDIPDVTGSQFREVK